MWRRVSALTGSQVEQISWGVRESLKASWGLVTDPWAQAAVRSRPHERAWDDCYGCSKRIILCDALVGSRQLSRCYCGVERLMLVLFFTQHFCKRRMMPKLTLFFSLDYTGRYLSVKWNWTESECYHIEILVDSQFEVPRTVLFCCSWRPDGTNDWVDFLTRCATYWFYPHFPPYNKHEGTFYDAPYIDCSHLPLLLSILASGIGLGP